MAKSLKSLFGEIGPILGMTPATLHMRQLAYMRLGLLPAKAGRGPGSGVPGTAGALAAFLVALMTDATVDENVPAARALAGATPPDFMGVRKPGPTFKDELTRILAHETLAAQVEHIQLLSSGHAIISGGPDGRDIDHVFIGALTKGGGFQRDIKVTGDAVRAMSKLVAPS
jgi:hypothetical protein